MPLKNIIDDITEKDYLREEFVRKVILDVEDREAIIDLMVTHADIMVYYHCYEIVLQASRENPVLFYQFWHIFAKLLDHPNSYHRDFGLNLIGNLVKLDERNYFSEIAEDYYSHINDAKFMTACYCLRNLYQIYQNKIEQRKAILNLLLEIDQHCSFTPKQMALMKYDVLEIFEKIFASLTPDDQTKLENFIRTQTDSLSPKTRRKARALQDILQV
jgi:hypothetical protein